MSTERLPAGLPEFKPHTRQAIVVNGYDTTFGPEVLPAIIKGLSRGSRRVYELEGLLSGDIAAEQDGYVNGKTHKAVLQMFDEDVKAVRGAQRYRVSRVQAYDDQWNKIVRSIGNFEKASDTDTLTFFYITSHGEQQSVLLNKNLVPYSYLLDEIDRLPGKKVLVMLACYSGSLLQVLEKREEKENYIVLTSTRSNERGVNWGEDDLQLELYRHIYKTRKLSELTLAPSDKTGVDKHIPQIRGSFDVVL